MSDYWKDFIPAIRTTRLGDCTDSDPELAAAWLGWQARNAEVAKLQKRIEVAVRISNEAGMAFYRLDDMRNVLTMPDAEFEAFCKAHPEYVA